MAEPWFDPNLYGWIPGTLLGVLAGFWGSLVGVLAPRGKAKGPVLGSLGILLASSVILFVLGIAALFSKQPHGVWYGLLLAGVIGLIVLGTVSPVVSIAYRQAENRKIQAADL